MKYCLLIDEVGDIYLIRDYKNGVIKSISRKSYNMGDNFYDNFNFMSNKLLNILKSEDKF